MSSIGLLKASKSPLGPMESELAGAKGEVVRENCGNSRIYTGELQHLKQRLHMSPAGGR